MTDWMKVEIKMAQIWFGAATTDTSSGLAVAYIDSVGHLPTLSAPCLNAIATGERRWIGKCRGRSKEHFRGGEHGRSREQVRRSLRANIVVPAAEKAVSVVCSVVMFYLGAKGHGYIAVIVAIVMFLLRVNSAKLTATSNASASNTSKLELLRDLEPKTLNELLRDDLPRWVKFPDVEKCEWLNKVIAGMWPYAK
ncbi:hypothetical protein GQ600_4546 [Phytophthora cactorum]|nr:hypothetical protein GQ600_4546 [Phytophthora cactorum]